MVKKRAFIRYTQFGELVPGSLIITTNGGYPINGLYTEVPTNICCDTDTPGIITSVPKGWVRYTKSGEIVPGSLIVGNSYPKNGIWKEVYINICCSITSTTTTTTQPPIENIVIGTQTWALRNLDVTTYRNGDPIPEVTDIIQWGSLTTGAWCWYANDSNYGPTYGKLYNWYAVNDPRGLAPIGYHVPSDAEWLTLVNYVGGLSTAGGALKSVPLWNAPNTGATNSSGFTCLAGGSRAGSGAPFNPVGSISAHWTSTLLLPSNNGRFYGMFTDDATVSRSSTTRTSGLSVRVIKD